MKIINPSAVIIEQDLKALSACQRIDHIASICYQRKPKATEEEAQAFCRKMIERKHMVPLEMVRIHLTVTPYDLVSGKYLDIFPILGEDKTIVSGSIRAFMEASIFSIPVAIFLERNFPLFFPETRDEVETDTRFASENEIPWQHKYVAVRVICSRAISHQLVRHRPVSILQESQRYCRYDGERFEGEVSFVKPLWANNDLWMSGFVTDCHRAEDRYKMYLAEGLRPQQARGVLPNDCKTELIMYASLPEWQHILNTDNMRCSPHADPEMRRIMLPLREEFVRGYPEVDW